VGGNALRYFSDVRMSHSSMWIRVSPHAHGLASKYPQTQAAAGWRVLFALARGRVMPAARSAAARAFESRIRWAAQGRQNRSRDPGVTTAVQRGVSQRRVFMKNT
jgi:hypothetical protein